MGRTDRFSRLFEADARSIADRSAAACERQRIRERNAGAGHRLPACDRILLCDAVVVVEYDRRDHRYVLLVRTISILGPLQKTFQRFMQSFDQYRSLQHLLRETADAAEVSGGNASPTPTTVCSSNASRSAMVTGPFSIPWI